MGEHRVGRLLQALGEEPSPALERAQVVRRGERGLRRHGVGRPERRRLRRPKSRPTHAGLKNLGVDHFQTGYAAEVRVVGRDLMESDLQYLNAAPELLELLLEHLIARMETPRLEPGQALESRRQADPEHREGHERARSGENAKNAGREGVLLDRAGLISDDEERPPVSGHEPAWVLVNDPYRSYDMLRGRY